MQQARMTLAKSPPGTTVGGLSLAKPCSCVEPQEANLFAFVHQNWEIVAHASSRDKLINQMRASKLHPPRARSYLDPIEDNVFSKDLKRSQGIPKPLSGW